MGKKVDLHATADIACLTTTHADGLSSHLLSRALVMLSVCDVGCGQQCGGRGGDGAYGLLGSASGWELHLLGLGLLDFLGRHVCGRCVF